jgi:hypothetical protein
MGKEREETSEKFEEFRAISDTTSWIILILFSLFIIGFGVLIYFLIPDTPRKWDYGVLPDTPAESIYSTVRSPTPQAPPRQLPPVPEVKPLDKSGAKP